MAAPFASLDRRAWAALARVAALIAVLSLVGVGLLGAARLASASEQPEAEATAGESGEHAAANEPEAGSGGSGSDDDGAGGSQVGSDDSGTDDDDAGGPQAGSGDSGSDDDDAGGSQSGSDDSEADAPGAGEPEPAPGEPEPGDEVTGEVTEPPTEEPPPDDDGSGDAPGKIEDPSTQEPTPDPGDDDGKIERPSDEGEARDPDPKVQDPSDIPPPRDVGSSAGGDPREIPAEPTSPGAPASPPAPAPIDEVPVGPAALGPFVLSDESELDRPGTRNLELAQAGEGAPGAGGPSGGAGAGGGTLGAGGAAAGGAGTPLGAITLAQQGAGSDDPGSSGSDENGGKAGGSDSDEGSANSGDSPVTRTVREIVEKMPEWATAALAGLGALSLLLGAGYLLTTMRARSLARQRHDLLQEVGLLQTALLPPVPERFGALKTSVAYRPAEGPGAGGDFYDVIPLGNGRVGFILGDVSGHGRGALARTAFMRYTLRAYLEAGLEPRVALQVAGRVVEGNLGGDFATVLLAIHDPDTGSLTYASAGHPSPIVIGDSNHEPVTAASSPPLGVGVRTGLRQTTLPLGAGSLALLFTDGLIEARTRSGDLLGRERLERILADLGPDATAEQLVKVVAEEARPLSDDVAACIIAPTEGESAGQLRTEQLELSASDLEDDVAQRFLEACGLTGEQAADAEREARTTAERFGGAVLNVVFADSPQVEVLPRNVQSIEASSRRSVATG